jgi:CheY-like chemotaxis protein
MTNEQASFSPIAGYFSQESTMPDGMTIEKQCDIVTTAEHLLDSDLVLIVDDDVDILELVAETLGKFGYDVLTARNGLEAAPILRNNSRVSILFTDIQMPGMGGEELAKVAVALRPDMQVIFTSGCSRPCTDAPFLRKPYKVTDLVRVLRPQSRFRD